MITLSIFNNRIVFAQQLSIVDYMDNARFESDFGSTGRIYGNLIAVAATKFLTDPAPSPTWNSVPSVLALDAYDNRIVWRYYSTTHLPI
jgi:hypothetical protein